MVRPCTVTHGRTRPAAHIDMLSQVTALRPDGGPSGVDHARACLLALAHRGPRPVVELAADGAGRSRRRPRAAAGDRCAAARSRNAAARARP
ncbi:DUF742 domain-containing protein [Streptomyces sp. DG2A-72]|uniref:DUF742 domain-containing protein n=1 Tax=Streptomyces sp. DG2A-72 TaxID=3051386 RepID=UPI00265BE59F|nr:DUF742 domain-containing protein [Streptomyces sp. DG2A-72]MDO0931528.1 DUF742 domain-containing protein [Streptomyces sp. DG2A-72]